MPNITIEAASPVRSIPVDPTRGWPGSPAEFDSDPSSPGNWSTIATPGTADFRTFDMPISPTPGDWQDPRKARVSGELEGVPEQPVTPEESLFGDPHIRRPTQSPPGQAPPQSPPQPSEPGSTQPPGAVPTHIETFTLPPTEPAVNIPSQPPIQPYQQLTTPMQHPPPQMIKSFVPPQPPPSAPIPPPQLTPQQISQAQKHCRFAISALDYEDFVRARQDLLDALKIIGG